VLPAPANSKKWEGKKAGTYVSYDIIAILRFPSAEAFSTYTVSTAARCCAGWKHGVWGLDMWGAWGLWAWVVCQTVAVPGLPSSTPPA
jgi:hypothetical protein